MESYEESYIGRLRKQVGKARLIVPAVRAVIQNADRQTLFIQRSDNGRWALPAGSMELHESVMQCLRREVKEETGLEVISVMPIAIYSEPRFAFTSVFGDEYQLFALVFRVDEWTGRLVKTTDETLDARFLSPDNLPDTPLHHRETLDDLRKFDGHFIVK